MPVPRQTSRARYPGSRPIGPPARVGEQRAQYSRCFGSRRAMTDFSCRFEQDAGMRANASANAASASGQPPRRENARNDKARFMLCHEACHAWDWPRAISPRPRHRAPKYAADRPLKPGGSAALGPIRQAGIGLIRSQKISRCNTTPLTVNGGGTNTSRLPSNRTLRTWSPPIAMRAAEDESTRVVKVWPSKV